MQFKCTLAYCSAARNDQESDTAIPTLPTIVLQRLSCVTNLTIFFA